MSRADNDKRQEKGHEIFITLTVTIKNRKIYLKTASF